MLTHKFPRVVEHDVHASDLPRRIGSDDLGGQSPGRSFLLTADPKSPMHKLTLAEFVRLDIEIGSAYNTAVDLSRGVLEVFNWASRL